MGETELKPWKDIEAVGAQVSGVGIYTTTFTLPEDWETKNGAILKIGSTNKHALSVYVNGEKARAVDFDALQVDISELVAPGNNEVRVEVASSLNNRLLARGYYEQGANESVALAENANNANLGAESEKETPGADMAPLFDIHAEVKDYGMVGEVKIITYTKVEI